MIAPSARNDEALMSKSEKMTSGQKVATDRVRHLGFVIDSSFAIRHSSFSDRRAFTLIELIVAMTVIVILTGLVLSTVGYVQKKGARARAETEIAAMSAACENYKADNGIYPRDATTTDTLDARSAINMSNYQGTSQYLYGQIAGDPDFDGVPNPNVKSYMQFKPNMLGRDNANKVYPRDPFGNSYGYSTIQAATGNTSVGYNPTFDLWSTTGLTSGADSTQWIKNW
jgi:prepilin-type N-terminal cleavage/methylation domain-containing protein